MKTVLQFIGIMFLLAWATLMANGCAGCQTCRGDEAEVERAAAVAGPPTPSPQTPPSDAAPPWRPVRDAFATPPTDGDGPDTPTPAPPAPPVAKVPGRARTATTSEAEGGLVISQNSGTIYLNSPGASPPTAPAAAMPMVAAYPLIPGPLSDQQVFSLTRRVGGALYYAFTGNCPAKPAPATVGAMVVPASYVMMAAPVAAPAQAPYVYVVPAASPAPQAAPMAPMMAPAATQGYYLPVASPQSSPQMMPNAPRKGLFGCLKKS